MSMVIILTTALHRERTIKNDVSDIQLAPLQQDMQYMTIIEHDHKERESRRNPAKPQKNGSIEKNNTPTKFSFKI